MLLSSLQTGQLGSHWHAHAEGDDVGEDDDDIDDDVEAVKDVETAVPLFLQGSSPHSEIRKSDEYKNVDSEKTE